MLWVWPLLVLLAFSAGVATITRSPTHMSVDGSQPPPPGRGYAQTEQQSASSNEHHNGDDDKRVAQYTPFVVINLNNSTVHDEVGTKANEESGWYTRPDWWVAFFTGMLFLATVGLWIFTALLWRTTRRAVVDGEKAILVATQTSAAATRQVAVMEGSERRQLRAYVGVDKIAIECPGLNNPDYKPEPLDIPGLIHHDFIVITIKNFGQTPAYDACAFGYFIAPPSPERIPDGFLAAHDTDIVSSAQVRVILASLNFSRVGGASGPRI